MYYLYATSAQLSHLWNNHRMYHGGAAAWARWAMTLPKFWLGGPQCIWPHQ